MQYNIFGKTRLEVSEVGFGTWQIGGEYFGATDDAVSVQALERALELGINFYDTAFAYGKGRSESVLGKAFGQKRPNVIIATKTQARKDPEIEKQCEISLKRLQREYIDVYLMHGAYIKAEIESSLEAMLKLKDRGLIRHIGISLRHVLPYSEEVTMMALECEEIEVLQVEYNLFTIYPERKIFPECQKANMGLIGRGPVGTGLLTDKYGPDYTFPERDARRGRWSEAQKMQIFENVKALRFLVGDKYPSMVDAAIRFAIQHPAVSVTIVGIKTPEQAEQAVKAASLPPLSEEELQHLHEIYEECDWTKVE